MGDGSFGAILGSNGRYTLTLRRTGPCGETGIDVTEWRGDDLEALKEDAELAAEEARRTFWIYDTKGGRPKVIAVFLG